MKWLERADTLLCSLNLKEPSNEHIELQSAAGHYLIRALIGIGDPDAIKRAWLRVQELDISPVDSLAVLILKLDLLLVEENFSEEMYFELLLGIIRVVHITESTVKTVLYYIHKLRVKSLQLAHVALETLLLERLSCIEHQEWAEQVLVTIIWNISKDQKRDSKRLSQILDTLRDQALMVIGATATHASQMVRTPCHETRSLLSGDTDS